MNAVDNFDGKNTAERKMTIPNTAALYFFPQHKTIFISATSPFKKICQ
jgi:hypothetical protein